MKTVSQIKNEIESELNLTDDCLIDNIIDKITCSEGTATLNEVQHNVLMTYVTKLEIEITGMITAQKEAIEKFGLFLTYIKKEIAGTCQTSMN